MLALLLIILLVNICSNQASNINLRGQSSLGISSYTGAGVSPQMQSMFLNAIINAYNQIGDRWYADQALLISKELEHLFEYRFTVLILNEKPQDTWFTLRIQDQIYAVWPGANQMQITWTYFILANGKKDDGKLQKRVYYEGIGEGISYNQRKIIESVFISLQQKQSCSWTGKYLGGVLNELDKKMWTSICKPITQIKPQGQFFAFLVTDSSQYYLGQQKKCICLTYV